MTSTYPLPFLPFFTVPPFLACGAPIKSSMLLAPLMPVVGLDGGADGGPEAEGTAGLPASLDRSSDVMGAITAGDTIDDG